MPQAYAKEKGRGIGSLTREVASLNSDEKNFLFGYASFETGNLKDADEFFKKCTNDSVFHDHLIYYRGRIALNEGRSDAAAAFFSDIVENNRDSVWAGEAKRYLAEARIAQGRYDESRRLLGEYIKGQELGIRIFDADLLIARSYMVEGDEEGALSVLKRMATSVISESELQSIRKTVLETNKRIASKLDRWMAEPQIEYSIAESLMAHSQWKDALLHLDRALDVRSSDFETRWLYARCLFKAHMYRDVIPKLEELLKNGPNSGMRLTLLQHLASAYARVDDYKHSIELRRKIISEYPASSSTVLDSKNKIAFLLLDDGHYKEAIDAFEEVLAMKGSASLRTKVLWYMAWSHYKLGQFDSAVRIMDSLLKGRAKKQKMDDRIAYWKARSLEKAGRKGEANSLYRQILADHPIGYYGVLSKRRIDGDVRTADDFVEAGGYRWPEGRFSVTVPDADPSGSHLSRTIAFDRLKLHDEAARELKAYVRTDRGANGDLVMWLASRNFVHDISYVLAHQRYMSLLRSLPHSDGFQRFIWEQSYPEAYEPVVEKLVAGSFDPKVVYSIMRAESTFRPAVVSPSGAVGLMQLMPVTAQRMSAELGEAGFDAHDLYVPAKNIGYGIAYLKKLYGLFPKNTVAVIASYNAGEEAVGRWLKHGYSTDIEEFIEEIPYDETNLYVKKVLMTYWILQQMYHD